MKSAQVESDRYIYHDLCRVTFFLYTRWTEKMTKRHNSYLSFQNTERLKIFQFTLSWTMAEMDRNGLLVFLQHGPKILLHNLDLFFSFVR